MVKAIQMKTLEDVKRVNRLATKCNFDVFVDAGSIRVDAKSLLGLVILLNKPNLMLVAEDSVNAKEFAKLASHIGA